VLQVTHPAVEGPSPPASGQAESQRGSLLELLGIRLQQLGAGRGRLEMAVAARHLRTLGILHGGVTATLLDTAMGMASGTTAPPDHYVVTIQLNVNFIRPAWEGELLTATGEVLHAGRQTAVARGELRTADGVLVATGSGTFLYLAHTDRTRDRIERLDDGAVRRADRGESFQPG
jgi:uncharacterized protein (TIGR00369 family)